MWPYPPRSFTLFGANVEERAIIYRLSINEIILDNWNECMNYLKFLYEKRDIRRA